MAGEETETRGTGWSSNRGSSRGQLLAAYREAGLGDLDHARRLLRVRMRPVPSGCEHDAGNHARFPNTSVTPKQSRQSHTAAQPREARLVAPNAGFARVFDVHTPRRYLSITVDASRSDVARWGEMRRECQRGGRRTGALTSPVLEDFSARRHHPIEFVKLTSESSGRADRTVLTTAPPCFAVPPTPSPFSFAR